MMAHRSEVLRIGSAILMAVFLVVQLGCSDDDTTSPNTSEAPEVPPLSTFLMDFSTFTGGTSPSPYPTPSDPAGGVTTQHYGWAAFNVAVWNTFITIGLAIPVATFVECFNHEPTYQEDGSWLWTYTVTVGSNLYTAELYGTLGGTGSHWEMYVTNAGEYEDFLWFTGDADLLLTVGTWRLYESPEEPHELIDITWHRNVGSGTADISYTNIELGGPENGGYIFYGITNDSPYDAFYDIYNRGQDNHTDIQWHRPNLEGRIRDFQHFNDDFWHCWDGNHDDVDCP